MTTPTPEYIVAEVSKTWIDGSSTDGSLLSTKFERVIAVNLGRGYVLQSFALSQVSIGDKQLCETIIAVFRRQFAVPRRAANGSTTEPDEVTG